jgi:hypothetical protein
MIVIIDQFPKQRNVKVFYLFPNVIDRENLPTPTFDWNRVDMSVKYWGCKCENACLLQLTRLLG